MKVIETTIPDLLMLEPQRFGDDRGWFMEAWNERTFSEEVTPGQHFVQDNHSRSRAGVLRGIHYQLPNPQGKLIRVIGGTIWDVAVDLRQSSPTFLKWVGVELSGENHLQLWIPPGFGHGFVTLSETADLLYKTTAFFDASSDRALKFDDPTVGIDWPVAEVTISEKDRLAPNLAEALLFD